MSSKRPGLAKRNDTLLMGVAAFALVGGTLVFRSFAAREVDTTKEGVTAIARVTDEKSVEKGVYVLRYDHKEGLRYCIKSADRAGSEVTVAVSESVNKQTVYRFPGLGKEYCYQALFSQENVRVEVRGIKESLDSLVVSD